MVLVIIAIILSMSYPHWHLGYLDLIHPVFILLVWGVFLKEIQSTPPNIPSCLCRHAILQATFDL